MRHGAARDRPALVGAQPLRADHQHRAVDDQGSEQDAGERHVDAHQHRGRDEHDLADERQDQEDRIEHQLAQALQAIVEDPADLAGTPGEMKAQRQAVQMLDRAQSEAALQALVDRAVERPARLVEDP